MNMASAQETGTPDASVDSQHPWLGLASFTEETRQYFYGRDEEVGELSRRVQRKLLTILFGQSGLGKTSILSAGIVPRLRPEGFCPVYVRIDYSAEAIPPGEQIKQAIFRATEAQGSWTQSGVAVQGESLWEFLHHRDDQLRDAEGKPIIPLLIFDQFEEIFTLAQADDGGRKRAAGFLEELADLVENRPPKALEEKIDADDRIAEGFDFARADYRILIALREDYLAHLEGVKGIMPSITQNRMRLARMNGQQALAAVMKPGGKLVTQEVAESIVRFVAGGSELPNAEVEPSLLSLICRELNNTRIAQGKAEISVDLLAGSKETILAEFYERALADQPAAVRKVIEDDLLTDSGYRENLAQERVLKAFTAAGAKPDAATTLATLVNRRLLRIEERLDIRRVELTHDVLTGVVKASREERMEREAREEAERKLAEQKDREAATRKALVRARQIAAGCAVLSVVAVGSAIYGIQSAQRARVAEAEAHKVRTMAETSRGEAEKLVVYLLDDFYDELVPVGRLDVVGSLAKSAIAYYSGLPPELRTPATQRNHSQALLRQSGVLLAQGAPNDAAKLIDQAVAMVSAVRDQGDGSVETLLALARASFAQGNLLWRRANAEGALKSYQSGLEILKPASSASGASLQTKLVEMQLTAGAGVMQRQLYQYATARQQLTHAMELGKKIGAVELTYLPATEVYLAAGRELSWQAYQDESKPKEAVQSANDQIALANRVLQVRPDHRPVLRAKAAATALLSRIEYDNLRVAAALKRDLEQHAVLERLVALDKSNVGIWINLGNLKGSIASKLRDLGRIDEGMRYMEERLIIPSQVKVDGIAARNLTWWYAQLAFWHQNLGDTQKAQASIEQSKKFGAKGKTGSDSDFIWDELPLAFEAVGLDLARRHAEARDLAAQIVVRIDAAEQGKPKGTERLRMALAKTIHSASYALGDFASAEAAARTLQSLRGKEKEKSLANESLNHQAGVDLALALIRQGKLADARKILEPMLPYFVRPDVIAGDDNEQQTHRAQFHLAMALANPEKRKQSLAEASAIFESRPASIRRWKEFALIGEEIARELKK